MGQVWKGPWGMYVTWSIFWVKSQLVVGEEQEGGSAGLSLPPEAHTGSPENSQREKKEWGRRAENSCSESSLSGIHKLHEGSLLSTSSPALYPQNLARCCLITGAQEIQWNERMRVSGLLKLLPLTIPL